MDNTNQTQTKTAGATANASATLKIITDGSNKKLLGLIPKGQSPKLYVDLLKSQVMKPDKAGKPRTDEDLLMFMYVCKRVGLDPLTKQIYAVFRWDSHQGKEVMSIQTGIDGMRLVAQRTGEYAGQDDIKFTPEDESTKYPTKASCTIYKIMKGVRYAFTASARWSEYVQVSTKTGEPTGMWAKMPYLMLGKCAEALALRKAFPNELSGIYSSEELAQTNNVLADLPKPAKPEVIHGAPEDIKKDTAIGSPEAKAVTEAVKPQSVTDSNQPKKDEIKTSISQLRLKIKETRDKQAKTGTPTLKVTPATK